MDLSSMICPRAGSLQLLWCQHALVTKCSGEIKAVDYQEELAPSRACEWRSRAPNASAVCGRTELGRCKVVPPHKGPSTGSEDASELPDSLGLILIRSAAAAVPNVSGLASLTLVRTPNQLPEIHTVVSFRFAHQSAKPYPSCTRVYILTITVRHPISPRWLKEVLSTDWLTFIHCNALAWQCLLIATKQSQLWV